MRCDAAHFEDGSECDGPRDAVRIGDGIGGYALGCVHHGARMHAALETPTAADHAVPGAAAAVIRSAAGQTPLSWMDPSVPQPEHEPTQKELAEGLTEVLGVLLTQQKFGLLPDILLQGNPFESTGQEQAASVPSAPKGAWRDDDVPPGVTNVFEFIEWAAHDAWDSWVKASDRGPGLQETNVF